MRNELSLEGAGAGEKSVVRTELSVVLEKRYAVFVLGGELAEYHQDTGEWEK